MEHGVAGIARAKFGWLVICPSDVVTFVKRIPLNLGTTPSLNVATCAWARAG
jgi:hypothetical protein